MPRFEWHTLHISVGEMSRTAALDFFKEAESIRLFEDQKMLEREVDSLITCYAPCKVQYNGKLLDAGTHSIAVGDEEPFMLALPLTREHFDSLPVSLTREWTAAAEAANPTVLDFFLEALRVIEQSINVIRHAQELS